MNETKRIGKSILKKNGKIVKIGRKIAVVDSVPPRFNIGTRCIYKERGQSQGRIVVITNYTSNSVQEGRFVQTNPMVDQRGVCEADLYEIHSNDSQTITATFIGIVVGDNTFVEHSIPPNTRFSLEGPPNVTLERVGNSRGW